MAELNERQQRFVDAYLLTPNGAQAAIAAGYSEKAAKEQASRLLTNANVAAAIESARAVRAERTQTDQDWVIERLKIEATREDDRASHSARVSALSKIGEHLGMFADEKDKTKIAGRVVIIEVPCVQHRQPTTIIEVPAAGGGTPTA